MITAIDCRAPRTAPCAQRARSLVVLLALFAFSGCAEFDNRESPLEDLNIQRSSEDAGFQARVSEIDNLRGNGGEGALVEAEITEGNGRVIGAVPAERGAGAVDGEVMLNFEDTDIQEVVKVVLADLMGANYIMEPGVTGSVSIQSSRPLAMDELLPVLESLLDINGAAMTWDNRSGLYRIAPRTNAVRSAFPPSVRTILSNNRPGFRTEIVPLSFIGVEEMRGILSAFAGDDTTIYVDDRRNLLVIAGTPRLLDQLNDTISLFDVDWMAGMSTGLYPLKYAEAATILPELEQILLGETGQATTSLIKLTAIERLNAVLVITRQPVFLQRAERWIDTLDRGSGSEGRRLFVYRVKNGLAGDLAAVLSNMFSDSANGSTRAPAARVQPGQQAVSTQSGGTQNTLSNRPSGAQSFDAGSVRIIADEINNALVIMATTLEYQMIEQALKELDRMPLQVLIEASIVEISLSDDLSYGVEWFLKTKGIDIGEPLRGDAVLDLGPSGINALSGFSYSLIDGANQTRAVINMLATESEVNVLSSPSVMVLSNQTATINVGDQVPVPSRQSVSTINPDSPTVNEIDYRDTGVILTVTPRVNPGGLITLEVKQEVSDAVTTESSDLNAPTIQQRQVESTVAVQSGNTVILGGLIRDRATEAESGIPGLYEIPLLGTLFGTTRQENSRTELIVLITPRAVASTEEAIMVTDEFRSRLRGLRPIGNPRLTPASVAGDGSGAAANATLLEAEMAAGARAAEADAESGLLATETDAAEAEAAGAATDLEPEADDTEPVSKAAPASGAPVKDATGAASPAP